MTEYESTNDPQKKNEEIAVKTKLKEMIPSHITGWRRQMIEAILTSEVFEEDPPNNSDGFNYRSIVTMGNRSVAFNCTNPLDFHAVLSDVSDILIRYKETVDPEFETEFILEPESNRRIKSIVEGQRKQIFKRLRDDRGHSPFPVQKLSRSEIEGHTQFPIPGKGW